MKRFVEIAWNSPISMALFKHLRNDQRYNEDHLKVFDSVTGSCGTVDFHADNVGMDKKKFRRVYDQIAERTLKEIIRLAEIGYEAEIKEKSKKS